MIKVGKAFVIKRVVFFPGEKIKQNRTVPLYSQVEIWRLILATVKSGTLSRSSSFVFHRMLRKHFGIKLVSESTVEECRIARFNRNHYKGFMKGRINLRHTSSVTVEGN